MPLIETKGAASAQGFGEFAQSGPATYIEDVFSTWLYTGNGSTQTITNGIDLSGKGGLVWIKSRSNAFNNVLYDTVRGVNSQLVTNSSGAATTYNGIAFQNTGFVDQNYWSPGVTLASWTFRKKPKFFDVVTYTGASPSSVTVNHNLGSVPGCIIFKCTNDAASWAVYHRSTGIGKILYLNGTQAASTDTTFVTAVTSTNFTVGDNAFTNNSPTKTYVAYLFAHDAGGFGLTGSDNVISCGSYTGNGVSTGVGQGFQVTLGYEPQFVIVKRTSGGTGSWWIADNMRGLFGNGPDGKALEANSSSAEQTYGVITPNATGFTIDQSDSGVNASGSAYIYIAIRRGPMKVPTSGTSVFVPITYTGSGTAGTVRTTGIVTDMVWSGDRAGGGVVDYDRLRGAAKILQTGSAGQEQDETGTAIGLQGFDLQNGYYAGPDQGFGWINYSGYSYVNWVFRRAPKFFDEVCYTGDGGATKLINHNLGVAPELLIVKIRGGSDNWWVYNSFTGSDWRVRLNASSSEQNDGAPEMWGTIFSSTQFQVGNNVAVNNNATSYVAYLFATCPGVSKVGTYTGTGPGTLITVNCGFTSGARFVLIRRLYGGDWYVYDSARGISSGSDPYLTLNGFGAEVIGTNYVDTTSVGFQVTAAAPYELNTNGLTFLFLAIA